jgi:hypothetical protein
MKLHEIPTPALVVDLPAMEFRPHPSPFPRGRGAPVAGEERTAI